MSKDLTSSEAGSTPAASDPASDTVAAAAAALLDLSKNLHSGQFKEESASGFNRPVLVIDFPIDYRLVSRTSTSNNNHDSDRHRPSCSTVVTSCPASTMSTSKHSKRKCTVCSAVVAASGDMSAAEVVKAAQGGLAGKVFHHCRLKHWHCPQVNCTDMVPFLSEEQFRVHELQAHPGYGNNLSYHGQDGEIKAESSGNHFTGNSAHVSADQASNQKAGSASGSSVDTLTPSRAFTQQQSQWIVDTFPSKPKSCSSCKQVLNGNKVAPVSPEMIAGMGLNVDDGRQCDSCLVHTCPDESARMFFFPKSTAVVSDAQVAEPSVSGSGGNQAVVPMEVEVAEEAVAAAPQRRQINMPPPSKLKFTMSQSKVQSIADLFEVTVIDVTWPDKSKVICKCKQTFQYRHAGQHYLNMHYHTDKSKLVADIQDQIEGKIPRARDCVFVRGSGGGRGRGGRGRGAEV